jgi:hypothetical protein
VVWTGSIWLRLGPLEGSCEYGNEPSGSYNAAKFLSTCTVLSFSRRAQLHEEVSCLYVKGTCAHTKIRHSSVGIAIGYGLDSWSSIPERGKKFVCTPWGPPSLLANVYGGGCFPGGNAAGA